MDQSIVGLQWGDEGKGKIVDFLLGSNQYSYCLRFNGGNNAGHTVEKNGKTYKLSLIPTGILTNGITNVITRGVVVNPLHFLKEITSLRDAGIIVNTSNLVIDAGCALIMPHHQQSDIVNNGSIGTTGRGIGPAYEDLYARRAMRVGDLILSTQELITKFSLSPEQVAWVRSFRDHLLPYVIYDAVDYYQKMSAPVLFEGAQGMMLDIFHGSYPYVTSSPANPAFASVITGRHQLEVIGVTKAYATRVGNGPFATEILDGPVAETLSIVGKEVGTVTGRKRRVGWLDLSQVKRSCEIAGCKTIVITKLDVLDSLEEIKVAISSDTNSWTATDSVQYHTLPGWKASTRGVRHWHSLPSAAQQYIDFIGKFLGKTVKYVSTGPDSNEILWR